MNKEPRLVLKGTAAYYELLVPEVGERLTSGELVFLHESLLIDCQYNCLKCFSDGSRAYVEQLKKGGIKPVNLNKSVRKRLIKEAKELGIESIVIPGAGEPLIASDLDEIIDVSSGLKMNLIIFTNGLLLNENKAKKYFSKGVSIIFNLDSLCSEHYDRLTGTKGNFETVLKNLKSALESAEDCSYIKQGYKVVPLAVNTNPTRLTYSPSKGIDEIGEIYQLIEGRATHFVSHLTPTGKARKNWRLLIGTENYSPHQGLKEAEKIYSSGLGGSSRRKDGKCAYIHNGVVQFAGYWMVCPNQGLIKDFGRYPEVSIEQHFKEKKRFLENINNPLCVTRR